MAAHPAPPGARVNLTVLSAVVLLILAVSLFGGEDSSSDTSRPPNARHAPQAAPASPAEEAAPVERPADRRQRAPGARPVRLLIPEIQVSAPFVPLSVGRNGQLDAPPADDVNLVGWHAEGAVPGETGTAIIAGHVDTATSPAVFAGLGELEKGDVFHVVRSDRTRVSFVVDALETFEKDDFPDERVYADADRPEVRLITCAGDYDRKVMDYTENLVVFAHRT
ncbi:MULTISPECIES: class F sortase [Streptomyces]|uniref:Class F sortase n=1 Tax=Streptomyces caniscabiei TaxID=2746961 RepID=A0ABU4MM61_9ACTN|nr:MULTISPECIES: class F sortase [Streptomyces]MBE4734316.1 class F sortase [Streptomyces caniscabiei]MBE4755187.1 class F sortase [Streptomyces caniscabiei]MBE4771166.1 class F sortase [Streptomyces caniscabiei]MBE4783528.1 class F sortase [Streptomyces caniscabiei]MBE4792832.1 class F sortase [Streptomyces caniscabiei]